MGKIIPSVSPDDELKGFKTLRTKHQLANLFLTKKDDANAQLQQVNQILGVNLITAFTEKPDLRSYDECAAAIAHYFELIADSQIRPTITGMAMALGITRINFIHIAQTGSYKDCSGEEILVASEVVNMISALKENFTAMVESFLESGLIHPVAGIFLLKNNSEYKDVVEKNYTVTKTSVDLTDMAKKYNLESD